jgi:hypothetical protein
LNGRSEKPLEPLLNKDIIDLETEYVRLGTVKLPRSIPTLASSPFVGICEENSGKNAEFQ